MARNYWPCPHALAGRWGHVIPFRCCTTVCFCYRTAVDRLALVCHCVFTMSTGWRMLADILATAELNNIESSENHCWMESPPNFGWVVSWQPSIHHSPFCAFAFRLCCFRRHFEFLLRSALVPPVIPSPVSPSLSSRHTVLSPSK